MKTIALGDPLNSIFKPLFVCYM